jgi:hypothetical protein
MPENPERLRRTLSELHEELESSSAIDPELRAPLRAVLQDIQAALDRSDSDAESPKQEGSLAKRLQEMALEFETDHPTLAGTLNRLTHALSSMGI